MFEYKGAKISAREISIGDADDASLIASIASGNVQQMRGFHVRFGEFMVGAVIDGEPPLPLVAVDDGEEAIRASYAAWRKLPRWFNTKFQTELEAVEGKNA